MTTNKAVEDIAALTRFSVTLTHWDKQEYNEAWIAAAKGGAHTFGLYINSVAEKVGKQAQGKGLYLASDPGRYPVKPETDSLMIVTCTSTPYLDVSVDPGKDSALSKAGLKTKDAVFKQEEGGAPPKILMKYGLSFYRLTTVEGVSMTIDLSTIKAATLLEWKKKLLALSDRTAFNAFRKQAEANGVDVSGW
jgi:hypothetical protein